MSDNNHNLTESIQAASLIEAVVSAIPAPVFYKDADGKYLGCNQAFEEFVGLKKEDMVGKTVFELWDKELAQVYHDADQALFNAGGKQIYEARVTYADGTIRDVMFHKAVFNAEQDQISGMVGVMLDITDRKKAEEASEAKSVFLSNMSHEFRTPLNGILGFAQLLRMNSEQNLSERQIGWINNINSSGTLLLEIVSDVLDLARIESGRIEYAPETFRPRVVFKECFDILRPLALKRNIALKGLPETDRQVHVDRAKLKQTLLNLISNAVKYNKENGFVQFGCRSSGKNSIELYVQDNGLGIPEEEMHSIFEPFHRVQDHTALADGTGVGLSIVKKNVELMKGTIEVTSTVGDGTCFTIILPAAKETVKDPNLHFEI